MKRVFGAAFFCAATVTASLTWSSLATASCGNVKIAEMNWASAQLMANVDKVILEKGYGCEVDLVSGDTMPTFTSMNEKGTPEIAPELWINAVKNPLDKAKSEKRLFVANSGPISGLGEGWFITPNVAKKHPELKTVFDVIKRPDLFPHPEDKTKGGIMTCPSGWNCQLSTGNLFRAYDMENKGWKLINPGSAAGLDASIAKASQRGENWFGYYWSPTTLVGKAGLVSLSFGVKHDPDMWHNCIVKPEKECANPKPTAWVKSEVQTIVTSDFMKKSSVASDYISKRVYPGDVMNSMLVFMDKEKADGKDAALEFLERHEPIWKNWVSSDAAKKIKSSM